MIIFYFENQIFSEDHGFQDFDVDEYNKDNKDNKDPNNHGDGRQNSQDSESPKFLRSQNYQESKGFQKAQDFQEPQDSQEKENSEYEEEFSQELLIKKEKFLKTKQKSQKVHQHKGLFQKSFFYRRKKRSSSSWVMPYTYRLWLIGFILFLCFGGIVGRLLYLGFQSLPQQHLKKDSKNRGAILDRHGHVLATTIGTFSVYAHPKMIVNKKEVALSLFNLFPEILSVAQIVKMLQSQKPFVWILRHITPEKKEEVQALGIQGLDVQKDYKRVFLHDRLFCHVVGLTDLDQRGVSGLEKYFNDFLTTKDEPLVTSLDLRLQHLVHYYLKKTIEDFEAKEGNAMIADLRTGEILAMVSLPDFSPYDKINIQDPSFFNRNTTGVYEFGSIMKIVNAAFFLEKGEGGLSKIFDARGCLWVGRFKVTDFQGLNRPMTVYEGFLNSSNLVNAQMALSLGAEKQYQFFQELGFTKIAPLEISEKSKPLLAPKPWTKPTVITSSYGYGFAITPLHVLTAIRALIRGYYEPMTLLKKTLPSTSKNPKLIVSPEVSFKIQYLLQQAVLEGKVKKAKANNCLVGAKTGTANCRKGRYYVKGENVTSCVGIFPINDPQYIVVVTLDRAKASAKTYGYATAGWIAAPLVSVLVEKSVPLLGLLNHSQKPLQLKKKKNAQNKGEEEKNEEEEEENTRPIA